MGPKETAPDQKIDADTRRDKTRRDQTRQDQRKVRHAFHLVFYEVKRMSDMWAEMTRQETTRRDKTEKVLTRQEKIRPDKIKKGNA